MNLPSMWLTRQFALILVVKMDFGCPVTERKSLKSSLWLVFSPLASLIQCGLWLSPKIAKCWQGICHAAGSCLSEES